MVTSYTVLKTIHVLAAIYWVGGNSVTQVLAIRARRSRDPVRIVQLLKDAEFVGQRTFLPASLILIASAFLLIADGNLDWELWLVLALIGWIVTTLVGAAWLGPETGRISKLADSQGPESAEVQARIARIFFVSRIDLALLVLIVIDMVIKPT